MKKEKVLILGYISFQRAKASTSPGFDSSLPKSKGSSPLAWILTGTPSSMLNGRGRTLPTASSLIFLGDS